MREIPGYFLIIIFLICVSILFLSLQFFIFHDPEESFFLLFQDFIFLPIEVILVSLLLDRFIHAREQKERLMKLNILITEFYSEAGNEIIACLNNFIVDIGPVRRLLKLDVGWDPKAFDRTDKVFNDTLLEFDLKKGSLDMLFEKLSEKKHVMLSVFENPNTLEHSSFVDTTLAVYHLLDELRNRCDLKNLDDADLDHLANDMKRAYTGIVSMWILNMKHLCAEYPYLFSLAARKNIFSAPS